MMFRSRPASSFNLGSGALRKEHKVLNEFKVLCAERLDGLEASFNKTECSVAVLRSQWAAEREQLDQLSTKLAPTHELARSLSTRMVDLEAREAGISETLTELREGLHEVRQHTNSNADSEYGEWAVTASDHPHTRSDTATISRAIARS